MAVNVCVSRAYFGKCGLYHNPCHGFAGWEYAMRKGIIDMMRTYCKPSVPQCGTTALFTSVYQVDGSWGFLYYTDSGSTRQTEVCRSASV